MRNRVKTRVRHLSILLLTAILTAAAYSHGDEIRDSLDQALATYETNLADIESEVEQGFAELFDTYADRGELEKAKELESHADRFRTEGLVPDIAMLRSIREKAKAKFDKASRELRTAYRTTIAAYTRARDLRAAEEVDKSLKEFDQQQGAGRLQFPRADKKPPAIRPKPKAPEPQGIKANAVAPNALPANRRRADQPRQTRAEAGGAVANNRGPSQKLQALINSGTERDVLSNGLASTDAKSSAMLDLYYRILEQYPPQGWTFGDCEHLGNLSISAYAGCKILVCPCSLTLERGLVGCQVSGLGAAPSEIHYYADADGGLIKDSTPRESTAAMVCSRFRVLWLASSGSPEEFISRTRSLQGAAVTRSVDQNFTVDELKVWLSSIGCDNRDKVSAAIQKLRKAGIDFTALLQFAAGEGL